MFSYGQGYVQQNYLENGVGYWLRFQEEGTSTLSGQVLNEISISLNADWNLITGISEDIYIYSANDPDGIIIENTLFGFSEGYFNTDTLVPGNAYWLRAFQNGEITLSAGSSREVNVKNYDFTYLSLIHI